MSTHSLWVSWQYGEKASSETPVTDGTLGGAVGGGGGAQGSF